MPFLPRNPYYLRISEKIVVPLYVYLDERHLDWMSDLILQHVLADLRPNIVDKLRSETGLASGSTKKNLTVETHRGETYQFCYFLRKTEPHSVVIKTRNFVAAKPQKKPDMPPPRLPRPVKRKASKVSQNPNATESRKKRKTKGKQKARDVDEEFFESLSEEDSEDEYQPVVRRQKSAQPTEDIMDVDDSDEEPSTNAFSTLEIEEEEEKPKPLLQLKYQGFEIYGHCLCIVVEPWPPIRATTKPVTLHPDTSLRAPSIAPPEFVASAAQAATRAKTPLFLPDYDRGRSVTPAFRDDDFELTGPSRTLPPVSALLDEVHSDSDDSDGGGMYVFSQVLSNTGESRAGAAEDDEDMDVAAAMFFGDADEVREL